MTDLLFDQILDELQDIHEQFPELAFGPVLQQAIDRSKGGFNKNLNDLSSKEVLSALKAFNNNHGAVRIKESVGKELRLQRSLDTLSAAKKVKA